MSIIIPRRLQRDIASEYRQFAATTELSALNGRFDRDDRTELSMATILRHLDFLPDHRVLDVGCGDARLLRKIRPLARAVGTVLTEAELSRLQAEPSLAGIEFYSTSYDTLPAKVTGRFDRIVQNSSLSNAGSTKAGLRALGNIVSLLEPGGKLWLGELFSKRAPNNVARYFDSKREAIHYVRAKYGLGLAARFAIHVYRRRARAERFVELNYSWWYVTPQEIPSIAAKFGLKVEGIWNCQAETGEIYLADNDRFSVLLSKPK